MTSRIDSTFQFNQTALSLRSARQELLASNIANADTPNYKAKDIDFASALQGAMSGNKPILPLTTTSNSHFGAATGENVMGSPVMYRNAVRMAIRLIWMSNVHSLPITPYVMKPAFRLFPGRSKTFWRLWRHNK